MTAKLTAIATNDPPRRWFLATVENGLGDRAETKMPIPFDRPVHHFSLSAIAHARAILPDVKPWKVVAWDELGDEANSPHQPKGQQAMPVIIETNSAPAVQTPAVESAETNV